MAGVHKLRLKMGEIEIELEGDKEFVKESFADVKTILTTGAVEAPELTKMKAAAVVEEPLLEKKETEAKPERKRGRPRKTEVVKAAESAVKEKMPTPEEVKPVKRRGRRKKVAVEGEKVDITTVKSLPELFKLKSPTKEADRILLMAYYINKVLRKREFRAADIVNLYNELKMRPPKNISYYLRKLSSEEKGFLVPGKKRGRYKISNLGIIYLS